MLAILLSGLIAASASSAAAAEGPTVAVRAGKILAVEGERVHENATLLIRGGRIVAIGSDLELPPGTQVIDYGPSAVIAPGFLAADSGLAEGPASDRTADPGLDALDGFDFHANYASLLAGGVTSAYITPARGRLIAGRGAIVRLAGEGAEARLLKLGAALHGAISSEARNVIGFWEPPVPATSDVGLGVPLEQLPRSVMGAILALEELLDGVRAGNPVEAYGPHAVADLAEVIQAALPWRITAVNEEEIRSLLDLAASRSLPLIVHGAHFAGEFAARLAEAGVGVIYEVPSFPGRSGQDRGVGRYDRSPPVDVPARLAEAGVKVALSVPRGVSLRDLRAAGILGARGGLSREVALRALTLTPAELYGVADRVGSLSAGKLADFAVWTEHPLELGASVLATWVAGELAFEAASGGSATVVRVAELHVGDGQVLRPGEILIRDGRIVEVAARVARPEGAKQIEAEAAMPGMVDALGRLGLGGSRRTPATDYSLSQIVLPRTESGRAVGRAGVTTVVLDPQGASATGAPMLAWRPAAPGFDGLVLRDPAALRLVWSDPNRQRSGQVVRDLLRRAVEYRERWVKYEQDLAAWRPEVTPPEVVLPPLPGIETPAEEEKAEEAKPEEAAAEARPARGRRGQQAEEVDPDPVTGIWVGGLTRPPMDAAQPLRMQLRLRDGAVEGFLRSAALSEDLMEVSGRYADKALHLSGFGDEGRFHLHATVEGAKLTGTVSLGGLSMKLTAERTTREFPEARRPERRDPPAAPSAAEPRGKPREPRLDPRLEPLRRALDGQGAIVVQVERADEIEACVAAFAEVGLKPILLGASDAHLVAGSLRDRVAGVLLTYQVLAQNAREGLQRRNRFADLQAAGIPLAFHSDADDGARDLFDMAMYAVVQGMSPSGALRALTSDAARMYGLDGHVGLLAPGRFGDVVLLDHSPLDPRARVLRVLVAGEEVP